MAQDPDPPSDPSHLQPWDGPASAGYLLNSAAHEINNHLTNLMLAADSLQYGGGPEVVQLMLDHAQKIADITGQVQALGRQNLRRGTKSVDLGVFLGELVSWISAKRGYSIRGQLTESLRVSVDPESLSVAFAALLRAMAARSPERPFVVSLERQAVPRSALSRGETIEMAVIRIRCGRQQRGEDPSFQQLVDHFWERSRSAEDAARVACLEVVRKLRGRMQAYGVEGQPGEEIVLMLPLLEEE